MAFLYQEIIDLNNQGVQNLQQGKQLQALVCFRQGLKRLVVDVSQARTWPPSTDEMRQNSLSGPSIERVPLSPGEENQSFVYDDVFGLFNEALHLKLDSLGSAIGDASQELAHYSTILSTVIMFNTGLTYHLVGLQKGNSSSFSKAVEFYSMAYESIESQECGSTDLAKIQNFCLLALANNIGHLHSLYHRYSEVSICRDEIAHRLRESILFFSERDSMGNSIFFLNACFFSPDTLVSAPAA